MPSLTFGIPVYDDFDGLYFTVQANRLIHQDVLSDAEFLIVDNHPGTGPGTDAIRVLVEAVPGARYVPFGGYAGAVVKDLIFREASGEVVLCVDSHVLLLPGSVRTLLEYFDARPGCRDLVQGPMCPDNLTGQKATHYLPGWGNGMWGTWATDDRGQDPGAPPFEIQMQGMGMFACRRDAWPGLNPRMRGHGGEEGYVHEKVRRGDGRAVCHPGVQWLHRFARPGGIPYPTRWRDRARNYVLAFNELGWDTAGFEQHLHDLFDASHPGTADSIFTLACQEAANPYAVAFDAVFCLHRDATQRRWARAQAGFAALGIDWLVEPIVLPPAIDLGAAEAKAVRFLAASAKRRGLKRIHIIGDEQIPAPGTDPCHLPGRTIEYTSYNQILASDLATAGLR
jgi:hypothetical protein